MRSEWLAPLLWTLAWRNLWRHTRRTLMILFAFALGVWSMIVIAAISRGSMEQQLDKAILISPAMSRFTPPVSATIR